MSINWYIGIAALGVWIGATLLYLRKYLVIWIGGWLERRRGARK